MTATRNNREVDTKFDSRYDNASSLGADLLRQASPKDFSRFSQSTETAPGLPDARIDLENDTIHLGSTNLFDEVSCTIIKDGKKASTLGDSVVASADSSSEEREAADRRREIDQMKTSAANIIAQSVVNGIDINHGTTWIAFDRALNAGVPLDDLVQSVKQNFEKNAPQNFIVAEGHPDSGDRTVTMVDSNRVAHVLEVKNGKVASLKHED